MEAELFHANGQTDMTKLIVAFRNSRTGLKLMHKQMRLHLVTCKQHACLVIILFAVSTDDHDDDNSPY